MTWIRIVVFTAVFAPLAPLWALPATLENLDYKVALSETLPGLDDQAVPQLGPTITVTIQDKFRSQSSMYPLPVYAIQDYFLTGDNLNLLCRITPKTAEVGPRYTFIQLALSSPSDSRQYQPLKQFSFSPGNAYMIGVFDGKGQEDSIGILQLGEGTAQLGWLYTPGNGINLFKKALPSMAQEVVMRDPVGWSADSGTAVFVACAPGSSQAIPTDSTLGYYLCFVEFNGSEFKLAAEPVDLSAYHYGAGTIISEIKCAGDKATLFFSQSNSQEILQADFLILKPGGQ